MTKELTVSSMKPLTAVDIRKQVNLIQTIIKSVMKEDMRYGVIPGTKKPTLFKPGAEKLMMTFRLAPEYDELIGSVEEENFISYKIECRLRNTTTGQIVGTGRGTCNSREKKYKTRSVYANQATDEEKEIGKKETKSGRGGGTYDVYIIPQDPWDLQNTIYKMACKRANIASVLNTTAASDIFEQDIEDLPSGTVEPDYKTTSRKPDVEQPKQKKTTGVKKILPAQKSAIRRDLNELDLTEDSYLTGKKIESLSHDEAKGIMMDLAGKIAEKTKEKK